MHEGRMIFTGPMRDMKRRLRRDAFHLELEADAPDVARLVDDVNRLEGVHAKLQGEQMLVVHLSDDRRRADALSEVLKLVDGAGLSLQAVHSGQNETEDAYLQLLQEDEAHGFHRFDLDTRSTHHAPEGDSVA
jgi:ABC-type multidrug transport system ATPase subunit